MDLPNADRPARGDEQNWRIVVSGDNGHELLQFIIEVEDFAAAAKKGSELAALIMKYGQSDYTQVTLRAWRVEVTLSAPKGAWWSMSQQEMVSVIGAELG